MRANPINSTNDSFSNALVPFQGRRERSQGSLLGAVDTSGLVPSPSVLSQEGIPSPALSLLQQKFGTSASESPVSSDQRICEYSALPSMKLFEFIAHRSNLRVNKQDVEEYLFSSLAPEQQTEASLEKISKALDKTVDPSGAVMLFIQTLERGVQLLQLHSQRPRRGNTFQTNGTCAAGESIRDAMARRFFEETGNPPKENILNEIVSYPDNRFSLALVDKIGGTSESIASRMIQGKSMYLNMSASYLNPNPVSYERLEGDLGLLNQRLADFASFYSEASSILFVQPAKDLSDPVVQKQAKSLINRFEEKASKPEYKNAPFITREVGVKLELYHQAEHDPVWIKKALIAIADLTEHDQVALMSPENLEQVRTTGQKLDGFFDAGFEILKDCLNQGPVADLFKLNQNPF